VIPSANFFAVAGKADTDPLFPDDPFTATAAFTVTDARSAAGASGFKTVGPPERPSRQTPAVSN
jgi:hypothetical protein